jgi:hypothetical protein
MSMYYVDGVNSTLSFYFFPINVNACIFLMVSFYVEVFLVQLLNSSSDIKCAFIHAVSV